LKICNGGKIQRHWSCFFHGALNEKQNSKEVSIQMGLLSVFLENPKATNCGFYAILQKFGQIVLGKYIFEHSRFKHYVFRAKFGSQSYP